MEEYLLNNGIRTIYYPLPHSYSVSIGLYVKTGSKYENENNNGITHFLEHMHFRQLGGMPQDELYFKTESMGGTLRAATYKEKLGLTYEVCSETVVYDNAAVISVALSLDKKDVYEGIKHTLHILNDAKKAVTDRDLDANLPFFTDNIWFWLEDPETLNFELALRCFMRNERDFSIEGIISANKRINKGRLTEIARSIFIPGNTTIVMQGLTSRVTKKEVLRIVSEAFAC